MTVKERLQKALKKGRIPLSDYMSICLYDERDGYYTNHLPIGIDGDFTTAPEVSQLFGEMIALWALDYSKGIRHNLIECGPGKGTLMSDISRIAHKYNVFKYHCVEVSPKLSNIQRQTLKGLPCKWSKNFKELEGSLDSDPCIFIANEFFDALPVDQFIYKKGGWHKRYVALERDAYVYKDMPQQPPAEILHKYPPPQKNDVLEYSSVQEQYFKTVLSQLKKSGGACIVIDYGYTHYAYGDTFQALKKHQKVSPLEFQSQADLTSHINFNYLKDMAENHRFDINMYTQASFLEMMGIKVRYEILCKQRPEHEKILFQGLDRLINKMGYLFKVMVIKNNEKV